MRRAGQQKSQSHPDPPHIARAVWLFPKRGPIPAYSGGHGGEDWEHLCSGKYGAGDDDEDDGGDDNGDEDDGDSDNGGDGN